MNENQNEYVDINAHDNYPDSEQKIEIPTMKVIPLKKICMTIGELPTAYLETMTYYEMLIWFIEYLKNNIVPTINNNASAIQEVQSVVLALQNYINEYKDSIDSDVEELEEYMNNYFENLDVQEEINNKLDQMLEDGVLEQIIEQFLQSTALWTFDNVSSMKLATNLANGSYTKTLGYYLKNDGGSAVYKIRNKTNDDVADEMFLIDLYDNALIAELNTTGIFIPEQLGAKNNGSTDASDVFAAIFNKMENNNKLLMTGTYLIDSPLYLPNKNNIVISGGTLKAGENLTGYVLNSNQTATTGYAGWNFKTENLTLENVFIDGSYTANGLYLDSYLRVKIISCTFHNFYQYGIDLHEGHEAQIIGTNIIGQTNGDESFGDTGILIESHDNIIDSCVIAYCKWGIEILQSCNQICNSHFYCNKTSDGGNIKVSNTSYLTFDNNYFDGSGLYIINPWNMSISNNIFLVSDNTHHIIKLSKTISGNPNVRGIYILNSVIKDNRTDQTSQYNFIECDFTPLIVTNCVIDNIQAPDSININNQNNVFAFRNNNIPIIIPNEIFRATNINHTIGEHSSIENTYEVSINGNYIDSNYIGSTSVYPWLIIKIYVPEKMLINKQMISNTSTDVDFWDSNETYIGSNKVTLEKGIYYVGIYRTHKILLSSNY